MQTDQPDPADPPDEPGAPVGGGVAIAADPSAAAVAEQPETPRLPAGDAEVRAVIVAALRQRPQSAHELVGTIEEVWPEFFAEREGYVHPLLLSLRRDGAIVSHWADHRGHPRRVHAAAASIAEERISASAANGRPAWDVGANGRLRQASGRATRGLRFAPELRDTERAEVLGHLEDRTAAAVTDGQSRDRAEKAAVKGFGDPWRVSTDLARTARGRSTVLFPRNFAETLRGALIYDAGMLLFIVAAIVFVRLQVVSAYHIPTRSMEPTLHGDERDGDRILVNRLAGRPERGDIWVFDGWHAERKNFVKRCIGLPGDRLKFREGDLYVNDVLFRKEGDLLDALLFPVYIREQLIESSQRHNPESTEAADDEIHDELALWWTGLTGTWKAYSTGAFHGSPPTNDEDAVLRLAERIGDDYMHPRTGELREGIYEVADRRITAWVRPESEDARVTIRLTRGASRYDAVLRGEEPGVAIVVDGEEVARADIDVPADADTSVRFSAVDHVLRLDVGGQELRHDLPQPEFPGDGEKSGGLEFRIRGGPVAIVPERIERDVFYNRDDEDDEIVLGASDYYMVGDNAGNSQDSRRNGPVHAARLIGNPILVVWPPSRIHLPR